MMIKDEKKELKRKLKREIRVMNRLQKFPPRYYAYKMMLKYISEEIYFKNIFNKDMLEGLFEEENNEKDGKI